MSQVQNPKSIVEESLNFVGAIDNVKPYLSSGTIKAGADTLNDVSGVMADHHSGQNNWKIYKTVDGGSNASPFHFDSRTVTFDLKTSTLHNNIIKKIWLRFHLDQLTDDQNGNAGNLAYANGYCLIDEVELESGHKKVQEVSPYQRYFTDLIQMGKEDYLMEKDRFFVQADEEDRFTVNRDNATYVVDVPLPVILNKCNLPLWAVPLNKSLKIHVRLASARIAVQSKGVAVADPAKIGGNRVELHVLCDEFNPRQLEIVKTSSLSSKKKHYREVIPDTFIFNVNNASTGRFSINLSEHLLGMSAGIMFFLTRISSDSVELIDWKKFIKISNYKLTQNGNTELRYPTGVDHAFNVSEFGKEMIYKKNMSKFLCGEDGKEAGSWIKHVYFFPFCDNLPKALAGRDYGWHKFNLQKRETLHIEFGNGTDYMLGDGTTVAMSDAEYQNLQLHVYNLRYVITQVSPNSEVPWQTIQ